MDIITEKLIETRLVIEGALSLYERKPQTDTNEYSLIGDALYLLRESISESLKAPQEE